MVSIRIFCVDFYMSSPIPNLDVTYSDFRGSAVKQVPIIRIFGSSDSGVKTCLNMHGAFPYIYIPYDGSDKEDSIMYKIAAGLDKCLNVSFGQANSTAQHVYKIMLVSGRPMYGFHSKDHQFLKIFFYNPLLVKRACTLLQNGNVLGKIFQPYEAHLPFTLQFMIDYNLHGMSFISLSKTFYRVNPDSEIVKGENILPLTILKTSSCKIEIDSLTTYIENRSEIANGNLNSNPGIRALWEDEKQRRINKGQKTQLRSCLTQNRKNIKHTESHETCFKILIEKLKNTSSSYHDSSNVSGDSSVYPAEKPSRKNLTNASVTLNEVSSVENSICLSQEDSSSSFLDDPDARELLQVLKDLRKDAVNEEEVEDSVLSQKIIQQQDEEEDLLDMSLTLDDFDISIPQLDGVSDNVLKKNKRNRSVYVFKPKFLIKTPDQMPKKTKRKITDERNHYMLSPQQRSSGVNFKNVSNKLNILLKTKSSIKQPRRSHKTLPKNYLALDNFKDQLMKPYDHKKIKFDNKINKEKCISVKIEVPQEFGNCFNWKISLKEEQGKQLQEKKVIEEKVEIVRGRDMPDLNELLDDKTCKNLDNLIDEMLISNGESKSIEVLLDFIENIEADDFSQIIQSLEQDTSQQDHNDIIGSSRHEHVIIDYKPNANRIKFYESKSSDYQNRAYSTEVLISNYRFILDRLDLYETQLFFDYLQQRLNKRLIVLFNKANNVLVLPQRNKKYHNRCKNKQLSLISLDGAMDNSSSEEEVERNYLQTHLKKQDDGNESTKLYDEKNNYVPTAGCSSYLSQTRLFLEEEELFSTSSSTLTPLTPYQKHVTPQFVDVVNTKLSLTEDDCKVLMPKFNPPTCEQIISSLEEFDISLVRNEGPFYSVINDVTTSIEVGHNSLKIPSNKTIDLKEFHERNEIEFCRRKVAELLLGNVSTKINVKLSFCTYEDCLITPAKLPPTKYEVERWLEQNKDESKEEKTVKQVSSDVNKDKRSLSPVLGKKKIRKMKRSNSRQISLNDSYGFKMSLDNLKNARAFTENEYVTLIVMELHVQTRGELNPDPEHDPIDAIFYSVYDDVPDQKERIKMGIFALKTNDVYRSRIESVHDEKVLIKQMENERELLTSFAKMIKNDLDPDIFAGYEIEMNSWGYLLDRGRKINLDLIQMLSRSNLKTNEQEGEDLKIAGRIVLDVWRLIRHEINLQSYTFENVFYHVLHKRTPKFSYEKLTSWWQDSSTLHWQKTIDYYLIRVKGVLDIFEQLDFVGRTSELARLFGIQFYEVLSRGSQFRVESMMLRLAKPLNYVPISPSVQQRAKMNAPEYIPLIFEPASRFYNDPVIVLDFQSLYPSIIIAYNYCFSTCLGKIDRLGDDLPFEFGAANLKVPRNTVKKLLKGDNLNFSPCGAAFVKDKVREGILPRMLREILDARLMVKESMKRNAGDATLKKVLHNRQLGLKLIANVTYGYTSANFSGRMPAVEIGDSVVSKGRETLLRAIKLIENNASKWRGAKVVYGDTDSIFVQVVGNTRSEAFRIGNEIAQAVTDDNPSPVKLKLEKILQPCLLQTKKRYTGFMYETVEQEKPELLSKGIETVRRDGCPAASKMLEKTLRILFETNDVSLVKKYVLRQFAKIFEGRVGLQDLTFAKEYRGESGYRPGACVPALELARKWRVSDPRREPRRNERVPYIIINGPPTVPLIKLVTSPKDLLKDRNLRPNALYYITRAIIPPLNRCLTLIGANVNLWFNEMPRKNNVHFRNVESKEIGKKSTISQYFSSACCVTCGALMNNKLCDNCASRPNVSVFILQDKLNNWERSHNQISMLCQSCCRRSTDIECISLDCPILYRLNQAEKDLQQSDYVRDIISKYELQF